LDHVAKRERNIVGKEKKIYAFFVDLKATFDNMDRKTMWEILRENNLEEEMLRRIGKIYERTEVGKLQDLQGS